MINYIQLFVHAPLTHISIEDIYISSIFSINYEASASELSENIVEMFPQYYVVVQLHTSVLPVVMGLINYLQQISIMLKAPYNAVPCCLFRNLLKVCTGYIIFNIVPTE